MKYSLYYQVHVTKEYCWMLSSTLKFVEHVAFDRMIDKEQGKFEFFVAPDLEEVFLDMMHKLEQKKVVYNIQKLQNRML